MGPNTGTKVPRVGVAASPESLADALIDLSETLEIRKRLLVVGAAEDPTGVVGLTTLPWSPGPTVDAGDLVRAGLCVSGPTLTSELAQVFLGESASKRWLASELAGLAIDDLLLASDADLEDMVAVHQSFAAVVGAEWARCILAAKTPAVFALRPNAARSALGFTDGDTLGYWRTARYLIGHPGLVVAVARALAEMQVHSSRWRGADAPRLRELEIFLLAAYAEESDRATN